MDPLASLQDLAARNVGISDAALAEDMLRVASASIRGAAGSPISQVTSTVTHTGYRCDRYLRLFGSPVTEVHDVSIDGSPVSDWRPAGERIWRNAGWGVDTGPSQVDVTYTHGLPVVPEDIVDLACSYAAAGMNAANEGYEAHGGQVSVRIDDYSVTYAQGAEAVATVMELPRSTRQWLASLFGGSVAVLATRS